MKRFQVYVLIPCHMRYKDQNMFLDTAINSLVFQTVRVKIVVSISFVDNEYKKSVSNIIKKYSKLVKFIFQKERFSAMQHIFEMYKYVKQDISAKEKLIMFCDDDDYYSIQRVETFLTIFDQQFGDKKNLDTLAGIVERVNGEEDKFLLEYWHYAIFISVLDEFFTRVGKNDHYLSHSVADILLRKYLVENSLRPNYVTIYWKERKQMLYHFNENDAFGVSSNYMRSLFYATRSVQIFEKIFIYVIHQDADGLKEYREKNKISHKMLKKIAPHFDSFKMFVKELYK